jgi:serine O-acetyltransferase
MPLTHPAAPQDDDARLDAVVTQLRRVRLDWREASGRAREPAGRELPSPDTVAHILEDLCGVLFPMRLGPPDLRPQEEDRFVRRTLGQTLGFLQGQIRLELIHAARLQSRGQELPAVASADHEERAHHIALALAERLPEIRTELDADVMVAFAQPTGYRSVDELMLCNSGVRALIHHRIAHVLYRLGAPLVARMIADLAQGRTGAAIHPGAQIGPGCSISHGTGVVIGEGVRLGQRVRLHQGVTLDADEQGNSPQIGNDVVIHAGATVLGGLHIEDGARIGGQAQA